MHHFTHIFTQICVFLLAFAVPCVAFADCDDLPEAEAASWQQSVSAGKDALSNGSPDVAIDHLETARRICDRSVELTVQMATAWTQLGDCQMARYGWDRVLELAEGGDNRQMALEALAPLEAQCPDSSRISVRSAEQGVAVELKGPVSITVTPPFDGRVPTGDYELAASKDGYVPYNASVTLEQRARHITQIPVMLPQPFAPRLQVDCADEDEFELVSGSTSEDRQCPWKGEAPDGATAVVIDVDGESQEASLNPVENSISDVRVPTPLDEDQGLTLSDWGWIMVTSGLVLGGSGLGLHFAARDLHDDVENPTLVDADGNVIRFTQKQADDILGQAEAMNIAGITISAAGGAILVTGLVLIFIPEDPYEVQIQPTIDSSQAGISFTGRF